MSPCLTPGNEVPVLIVLGAAGTGKTAISQQLGESLGLAVVENAALAEDVSGLSLPALMVDDPERGLELLRTSALECLTPGGEGAGTIAVLNASAPLAPEVAQGVQNCRALGSKTVALSAPLDTLVRRNGLNAARPTALGTPRAWFRQQLQAVEQAYSPITDLWCDTDTCAPQTCALEIIANLGLRPVHD